jgi:hypothetical protein
MERLQHLQAVSTPTQNSKYWVGMGIKWLYRQKLPILAGIFDEPLTNNE